MKIPNTVTVQHTAPPCERFFHTVFLHIYTCANGNLLEVIAPHGHESVAVVSEDPGLGSAKTHSYTPKQTRLYSTGVPGSE